MPKQPAKPRLRRLEQIQPVDFWPEAADFIDWLEEADTLELLGEALGLELEPLAAEDEDLESELAWGLCCRAARLEQPVLIVPQLGPADALSLGQVVTQAAQAVPIIIWIASEFPQEYQRTLTWLDRVSGSESHLVGVAVEVWKIGKDAAAQFTPVVLPSAWEGTSISAREAEPAPESEPVPEPLTEIQQENLEFWNQLCERLEQRGSIVKAGAPVTESAMGFAIARADFRLYAVIDREHQSFHTELLLSGEDAHPHFYLLAQEQDRIVEAIELALVWDDSDPKSCSIYCTLPDGNISDRDRWKEYQTWICDCLERFHETFSGRIKRLNATDYQPLPDYGFNPLSNSLSLPS